MKNPNRRLRRFRKSVARARVRRALRFDAPPSVLDHGGWESSRIGYKHFPRDLRMGDWHIGGARMDLYRPFPFTKKKVIRRRAIRQHLNSWEDLPCTTS